ncbi:MAG: S-layer homology domain-containing protein [Quinella sp. 1Q7]|nr:S-layer homology domain-containing protein [Quinella sp. 1Q7]
MKKTVVAALAAAFVVGATSTTFAAANPFSDVPAGHWAYNSVAKLAAEGVIEGYGDGTYRGDRNITRYEMAQMVAKAMAKNPSGANKAELDRLAAEFRDELDALGVRVSNLEKYADKVTWTGELRYRYWNNREKMRDGGDKWKRSSNSLQMRFFPTAEVNDHWKLKARITANHDMSRDESSSFKLTYGYAEGTYGKFQVKLGKQELLSDVDQGLVVDDYFSGAQVSYGDKFKVLLEAGRWNLENADVYSVKDEGVDLDPPASYQGAELSYDIDKFYIGAALRHFRSDAFRNFVGYGDHKKNATIWSVGTHFNLGPDFVLGGAYARNSKALQYKTAYNIALDYKGANKERGSWGLGVAYRYIGQNVGLAPTFDTYWDGRTNKRGVEFIASWSPLHNTLTELRYFTGKTLDTKKDTQTFFGRVSWFF